MFNFLVLIFYYFLILVSILGYGTFFLRIFEKKLISNNFGYVGLFGLYVLLIYSYLSNFIIAHSEFHNIIILIIGIIFFFLKILKNYSEHQKEIFLTFLVFVLISSSLFLYKNHDDFPYYHFAYIQLITKFSNSLGLGLFNHGFRTPSSIFYLSSLFYLPKAGYSLIHLAPVFFLGFSNYIFINKIYLNLKNKENFYIILLSLSSLALANIFFYRMAEHGTDRSAQIIILIIFIELLQLINLKKINVSLLNKILILITITISLKAFYLIYAILLIPIVYYQKKKFLF